MSTPRYVVPDEVRVGQVWHRHYTFDDAERQRPTRFVVVDVYRPPSTGRLRVRLRMERCKGRPMLVAAWTRKYPQHAEAHEFKTEAAKRDGRGYFIFDCIQDAP
jgi:hypothetical protein